MLCGHDNVPCCAAFSPDGRTIASGAADATVRLWDTAARRELHVVRGHAHSVLSLAFSPDGRPLVVDEVKELSNDQQHPVLNLPWAVQSFALRQLPAR